MTLGPVALRLLKARRAVRKKPRTPAAVKAKLGAHAPALAFERDYGGLSIKAWLIGPVACLESGMTFSAPGRKKLVPVVVTDNDNVYFIAADGTAWAEDAVEDPKPVLYARNARAMFTRILFREHVFYCPEDRRRMVDGAHGAELALEHRLEAIADASDAEERWWSDGKKFVVERNGTTTFAYGPKAKPVKKKYDEPVTFASVMNEYPPVCVVTTVNGEVEDVFAKFVRSNGVRAGGTVALGGGRFQGTVRVIDGHRIGLLLGGKSRAEIFFRDNGESTLVNVFQFDVKAKECDAVGTAWHDHVLTPLS